MSGDMLADETGVIPHFNVMIATLEPYISTEGSTKILSLKAGDICTMNLEVHIPGAYAPDEIFLIILSWL